jgi:hypothetical protein
MRFMRVIPIGETSGANFQRVPKERSTATSPSGGGSDPRPAAPLTQADILLLSSMSHLRRVDRAPADL